MECINYEADVPSDEEEENEIRLQMLILLNDFIDNTTNIKSSYRLTNVTRDLDDAMEDDFSEGDVERYQDDAN